MESGSSSRCFTLKRHFPGSRPHSFTIRVSLSIHPSAIHSFSVLYVYVYNTTLACCVSFCKPFIPFLSLSLSFFVYNYVLSVLPHIFSFSLLFVSVYNTCLLAMCPSVCLVFSALHLDEARSLAMTLIIYDSQRYQFWKLKWSFGPLLSQKLR